MFDILGLKYDIKNLSELTGINIYISNNNNLSCTELQCDTSHDCKISADYTGSIIVCPCNFFHFRLSVTPDITVSLDPMSLSYAANPANWQHVSKTLKLFEILKTLVLGKPDEELIQFEDNIKSCIIKNDFKTACDIIEQAFIKCIEKCEGSPVIIKARLLEFFLATLSASYTTNLKSGSKLGCNFEVMSDIANASTISDLYDSIVNIKDHLCECLFTKNTDTRNEVVKMAIDYIEKNYARPITLSSVAESVYVSKSYLSRIFKEKTGENYNKFINRLRVEKSINLLKNTNMSIYDIAIGTGFMNSSYYAKVFAKFMSMTPGQYKSVQERIKSKNVDL